MEVKFAVASWATVMSGGGSGGVNGVVNWTGVGAGIFGALVWVHPTVSRLISSIDR